MKLRLLFSALIAIPVFAHSQDARVTPAMKKAMDALDTMAIRSHIEFLADDILRGRLPGTVGYRMAADYVIEDFTRLGIQPAGDNGDYRQRFTVRRSSLVQGSLRMALSDDQGNTDSLHVRTDVQVSPHPLKGAVVIENAPLVFAGYGVEIAGRHNDYEGLDVKGKIVVVINEVPEGLPSAYRSHFRNLGYKIGLAASKGAVGTIVAVNTPRFPSNPANAVNPDKTVAYGSRYTGNADLYLIASYQFLNSLFHNSGKSAREVIEALRNGKQSFELGKSLSVRYESAYEDIETYNVIGVIPGTDKNLKSEYIVHTAHLDHVGIGRAVDSDSIYNGAHDNASGVASLLEIARLYKTSGVKPKRSILITMVSAEESGLLGSSYFASNPTVPKQSIVANLNTDMPVVIAPFSSVIPLGASHSTISGHVEFATRALGLEIQDDPEPEENFFVRSDQYSFVREHIPALHIKAGRKSPVQDLDLDAYVKAWRAKYYHKPADQLSGGLFHFGAAKTYVLVNFLTSYSLSMAREKPRWNPGELF